jgi:hypothetical protein
VLFRNGPANIDRIKWDNSKKCHSNPMMPKLSHFVSKSLFYRDPHSPARRAITILFVGINRLDNRLTWAVINTAAGTDQSSFPASCTIKPAAYARTLMPTSRRLHILSPASLWLMNSRHGNDTNIRECPGRSSATPHPDKARAAWPRAIRPCSPTNPAGCRWL